jgi:hypothetical protein
VATKIKKLYSIDSKVVDEFQKCCKQNGKDYSEVMEELQRLYIERQGNILLDDIYAPRLDALVSRTLDKAIDRIAGMVHNINVDILATMYLQTALHKKGMQSTERILDHFLPDELLNPARTSIAESYRAVDDATNVLIPGSRNAARKQVTKDIKERTELKRTQQNS